MATGRVTLKGEAKTKCCGIPGFKHIFLFFLLIGYTFLGAYLMIELEETTDTNEKIYQYETKMKEFSTGQKHIEQLQKIIQSKGGPLNILKMEALQWCITKVNTPEPQLQTTEWNLWQAVFYVTSLYTTVGYGNINPSTIGGRCFTMFYAILGIPLVLSILSDWGNLLFRFVASLWNEISKLMSRIMCCRKRKIGDKNKTKVYEMKNIPILLAIFICVGYICFCAAIFLIWEDEWSYFVSFYFFFISLTTIGLGDVIPKHVEFSVYAGLLVLFGLSVVSMCLNVIQAKLDGIFKDIAGAIDRKYKDRLEIMEDNDSINVHLPVIGMRTMEYEQTWQKRLLYQMMNDQKKQLLKEQLDKKCKLRNKRIQTVNDIDEFSTQTDNQMTNQMTQTKKVVSEMMTQTSHLPTQAPNMSTQTQHASTSVARQKRKATTDADTQTKVAVGAGTQTTEEVDDLYIWSEMSLI